MHKRGISTLIATVLIIGITISAFGVVYTFVMPLIKENIGFNKLCGDVKVMINTQKGYTCYNSSTGQVNLQVSRGPDAQNISSLQFKISGEGNSNTVDLIDGIKPIGLWHMDEGAGATSIIDSSGNGHTGKINSYRIDGKLGNALNFDGVDDWINYGNPAIFNFTNNDFSMEAWIKPIFGGGYPEAYYMEIIGATEHLSDHYYWFGINSLNRMYAELNESSWAGTSSSTLVTDGSKWYHVVFTKQSNNAKFYINGILDNVYTNAPRELLPSNYVFRIGSRGGIQFFNGTMDEVRIYNRELSSIEVSEHYNGMFNNESNLIGYWPLDESSGISAADSSGQGNIGALENFKSAIEYTSAGRFGGAYEFDGEKGYINISDTNNQLISNSTTTMLWFKAKSTRDWMTLLEKRYINSDVSNPRIQFDNSIPKRLIVFYNVIGGYFYVKSATIPLLNEWYHLAVGYNGISEFLYVNGVLENTTDDGRNLPVSTEPYMFVGKSFSGQNFNGTIDEVSIYDRALNSEEIKKLYGGYEIIDKVIIPNGERTYVISVQSLNLNNVDSVSVAPIVKVGNKEHVCSMTADVQIQNC